MAPSSITSGDADIKFSAVAITSGVIFTSIEVAFLVARSCCLMIAKFYVRDSIALIS